MSTAAIGLTAMATVTAAVGMLVAPALSHLVDPAHSQPVYFRLFFLIFIMQSAEMVPFLLCRALHRSSLVVIINLARLFGLIGLNILFVVHFRQGVFGILLSNLIVTAVVAFGMLVFLFRNTGVTFSGSLFKEMARYAYPVAFVSLGNFFLVFSDRYFLNHFVGPAAVGIYSLAYRFVFILSTFVFNPFQQIWGPQRFLIAKQPNAREIFRRVFFYINIALGGTALAIALFARDVIQVMATHAFWSAYRVIPFLLLAQILHFWTAYNNLGLFLTNNTKKFAWGSAIAIPSVLALNYLLIPTSGVWGAVIATLIAYVLRFLVIQTLSQQEYRIDYDWARIFKLYSILVAAFLGRSLLGTQTIVVSVSISAALFGLAIAAIFALVLSGQERHALREMLRRRRLGIRQQPPNDMASAGTESAVPVAADS